MSAEDTVIPQNVPVLDQNSSRNDLIATAVKFLQNPKVQSSPLEQKKSFLKKKGLTDAEVDKAVELSGVSTAASSPPVENQLVASPYQPVLAQPAPVSGWVRIREYSSLAIIVGGIVYGIYSLYKKFIEPVFLKRHEEEDKKWEKMQSDICDLNTQVTTNLQKMLDIMSKLQQQIVEQNTKLMNVSSNLEMYKDAVGEDTSEKAVSTLRSDIISLKGLLLNAKQFPASPAIQPTIPSWQMQPSSSSSNVVGTSHTVGSSEPNAEPHKAKTPADLEQSFCDYEPDEEEYRMHGNSSTDARTHENTDKLTNGPNGDISAIGSEKTSTPTTEAPDLPGATAGNFMKSLSAVEDSSVIDESEID